MALSYNALLGITVAIGYALWYFPNVTPETDLHTTVFFIATCCSLYLVFEALAFNKDGISRAISRFFASAAAGVSVVLCIDILIISVW